MELTHFACTIYSLLFLTDRKLLSFYITYNNYNKTWGTILILLHSHSHSHSSPLEHSDSYMAVGGCQRESRAQAILDGVPSCSVHSTPCVCREQAGAGGSTNRAGGLASCLP